MNTSRFIVAPLRLTGFSILITLLTLSTCWAHSLPAAGSDSMNESEVLPPTTSIDGKPEDLYADGKLPFPYWTQKFYTVNNIQVTGPPCVRNVSNTGESTIDRLVHLTENILAHLEGQGQPSSAPLALVDHPRDCYEILVGGGGVSGRYAVYPDGPGDPFFVYCDMETDGGGWTVFQRRENGGVDFYRDWCSYKNGFGSVSSEHWLGNDKIHRLSSQKAYHLRVDLRDFEGETRHANYSVFRLNGESTNYTLSLSGYSGDAGDSLGGHSGYEFSTKDRDNDSSDSNCAVVYRGGWWYTACHASNLNGLYLRGTTSVYAKGVVWYGWREHYYSLMETEMKIRPIFQV